MAFFWVNLGETYSVVAEHKFLWAPSFTLTADGKKITNAGWLQVQKVKENDVIFCHEDGKIIHVAVAKDDAHESDRPSQFPVNLWKMEGFKVNVHLKTLDIPLSTRDLKDTLYKLYNERCIPKLLTVKKHATQNYMISIPDGAGAYLLDAIGYESIEIQATANHTESINTSITVTEREALIKARVGQGKFRENILSLWKNTCPVTGVNLPELLIASHIVPWQLSNDAERLDVHNGFPLSPSVDKLFDKGYISFTDYGEILFKEFIPEDLVKNLGITKNARITGMSKKNIQYLRRHRAIFGYQ